MPRAASEPASCIRRGAPTTECAGTPRRSSSRPDRWVKTQSTPLAFAIEPQAGGYATASGPLRSGFERSPFSRDGPEVPPTAMLSMRNEASQALMDAISSRATRGNSPASVEETSYGDGAQFWRRGEESLAMVGAFTDPEYVCVDHVASELSYTDSSVGTCWTPKPKILS